MNQSLTIVEQNRQTELVLSSYFDLHPMGIRVQPGVIPPPDAFEVLGWFIATKADQIRWHTGAWCNLFIKYHGQQVYEKTATVAFRKPQTIEVWAYVERNVPEAARVCGLSLEFHRLVAPLKNQHQQKLYLRYCRLYGLSHSQFERWLRGKLPVETSQPKYHDKLFDTERELYDAEIALQEQQIENGRLQQQLAQLTESAPDEAIMPEEIPAYVQRSIDNLGNGLIEFGYNSVTVYRDGSVRWQK